MRVCVRACVRGGDDRYELRLDEGRHVRVRPTPPRLASPRLASLQKLLIKGYSGRINTTAEMQAWASCG
ncbi:unnamed protein product [Mesocestoides corti]|uniref:Transposase n=1 Tax=Mesocestoides corti TaxID=53468 RepID=A0A0R3U5W6_MESCO|nr:unnamed protein product [Mesocestoides corti]